MPDSALRITAGVLIVASEWYFIRQCRKPSGWLGRVVAGGMNRSHGALTSWGLEHVQAGRTDTVLDVGCGGGGTVQRLARLADLGTVRGIDYAAASVAVSRSLNKADIETGRVAIERASVSHLPYPDDFFDLVTAVETHYYWPDRPADLLEIFRTLKAGGTLAIIAEVYRGRRFDRLYQLGMRLVGGAYLTPEQHREMLAGAGYADVQVHLKPARGWICVTGRKPDRATGG
jgi:SAM-dependent methyltransferase